jgi:zinc protease
MKENGRNVATLPAVLDRMFDEEVDRFLLPSGLTLLSRENHTSGLVSVQLWVKAGSIHEGDFLGAGLSHYLEHLLFKGTPKRPGTEISRAVHAAGGYINAYTTFDRTVYHIDAPSEACELAIDILGDAALNSTLPADEVVKERDVILREIDMGLDDPDRRVGRALFSSGFREHPYRLPVIGHRDIFETVTREDLERYYRERYVPNNMVLIVVGDIEREAVRKSVEQVFGDYPRKHRPRPFVPDEPEQLALREAHLYGDVNICRGGLGFKIPSLSHRDSPGLDLLASILGNGDSSILWQRLREDRRLVHHVDASSWNPGSIGLFWISYLCDPLRRQEAQEGILEELEGALLGGITQSRIEKARRQALVSEINIRKTMSGQASRLGLAEVVVGDLGYPRNYFMHLQRLTVESLGSLIETYLRPERLTAISLNERSAAPIAVRSTGESGAIDDFEVVTLKNGVRLVLQNDGRLPKVNIRVICLGGPLYEDPSLRGATGVLATMLTRDTEKRTSAEVAETIEGKGGTFFEFAGNNTFGLTMEVLPDDLDLALELLADGLTAPKFLAETFERERDAQIASLQEDLDEIVECGKKGLRRRFFGDHPYAVDACGTEESLRRLGLPDIHNLYRSLVVSGNLVVSVSGDVAGDRAKERLESIFGALPAAEFDRRRGEYSGPSEPGEFVEIMEREQAVVFQGFPDCGVTSEDYIVGDILDELLSEMSGELFKRVREDRSLAYFVGASRISGVHTGMFYLCAGTHPSSVEGVIEEFDRELSRIRKGGLREDEVRRCKTRLKAAKTMSLQTIGAKAMQAGLNVTYGLPANDWNTYNERIEAISIAALQRFAEERLVDSKRVGLVVKP